MLYLVEKLFTKLDILGDPGADSGDEEKATREGGGGGNSTKKRREEK